MKTQEEIEQLAKSFDETILAFIKGYTQGQEDMADKKYTEEDMRQVFEYGKTLEPFDSFEDFINSLNKQD